MSVQPELMKECVVVMGVAGDIDEDSACPVTVTVP